MVDIKKELYHAKLQQELKTNQEVITELKESYNNIDDPRAKDIIKSLILKHERTISEVSKLLRYCIVSSVILH